MVFLGLMAVILLLFAEPIIRLFTQDPEVIPFGAACLEIVSLSFVFWAYGMVTVQAFNGAGDTLTPTWINLFCYWIFQIPLAYLLALPLGLSTSGVFIGIAVAQTALAVVGVLVFRRGHWKAKVI
jgi:Na+-driven multidrug efflux pump